MKQFIIKGSIFLIVIYCIAFGIDYIIQEGLKSSNYREVTKWNEVIQGGIDAELVIVGSSRALDHFDCEYLEKRFGLKCYNLGIDGSKYSLQREMLKLYLSKNLPPEKILWSLDLHSFEPVTEFAGFEQFVPFQENSHIKEMLRLNYKTPGISYQIPIVRYSFNPKMKTSGIYSFFGKKGTKLIVKGYRQRKRTWDGTFENRLEEIEGPIMNYIDRSIWNDFIVETNCLRKNGIEIDWVVSPYYGEVDKVIGNHQEIISRFEEEAKKNQIVFLDFAQPEWANSRVFFFDWRHLSEPGVEKFMEDLVNQLKLSEPFS